APWPARRRGYWVCSKVLFIASGRRMWACTSITTGFGVGPRDRPEAFALPAALRAGAFGFPTAPRRAAREIFFFADLAMTNILFGLGDCGGVIGAARAIPSPGWVRQLRERVLRLHCWSRTGAMIAWSSHPPGLPQGPPI